MTTTGAPAAAAGAMIKPEAEWDVLLARVRAAVPEAFGADDHVLNLIDGEWAEPGHPKPFLSPVDGTFLGRFPMVGVPTAERAVRAAAGEFRAWSRIDLDERRRRVSECLDQLDTHRELLAYLLVWEIGKPHRQAMVEVDRTISGVSWYVDHIEHLQAGRRPIGLISNIASWNYPLSVLLHAALVQVLTGNTVIAKTPSDGGLFALTLAFGIARRCGLPVSLISGSGGQLSEPLVREPAIAGVAFVGGKATGRQVAESLYSQGTRFMIEMEGVNSYGVWNYSDWPSLATMMRKGFEYGKQRCTAYTRWVVQRELFPAFLETYLDVARTLTFGNPLLVRSREDPPPDVDFGPLINAAAAENLRLAYQEAVGAGAVMLFRGEFDESRFLPDQDTSAYFRPVALLDPPRNCTLYHSEPFGPVDSFVVVDRPEELVAEMNVSNGALVASIACDDTKAATRLASELRAFKVGINRVRSRGDRDEPFGGLGESWKGCFVGGEYLVRAVTEGPPEERLVGNFPDHTLLPETA
jgi:acyl-CoA reductase-like NAD-dependent aldehyde dehydrogenase